MRWLDGIIDSMDMSLSKLWESSSRSWWWTGKPGVLQSMWLQRVGNDWATELNWMKRNRSRGVKSHPKVTQLVRGDVRIQTQAGWPMFWTTKHWCQSPPPPPPLPPAAQFWKQIKNSLQTRERKVKVKLLHHFRLFATPWTIAYQAPLSMEFSRQEYWSGLPCLSPGDLSDPGIEPQSPTL